MSAYGALVLVVVFGIALLAGDAVLLAFTPRLLAGMSRIPAERRAGAILMLRFLPLAAAFALTALAFVPAWWRHEPLDSGETVTALLAAAAVLSLLPILEGARRAARMVLKTRARTASWRSRGKDASTHGAPYEILEVGSEDLALCVGGYLRPTIYASTRVLSSLDNDELAAAFAHETSHAQARDPLRLLGMGSCPDFLQLLMRDGRWRRDFAVASEFGADARASRGKPEVGLDLASALLKIARLGTLPVRAEIDVAVSSAFSSPQDLEARVQALAHPASAVSKDPSWLQPFVLATALLLIWGAGLLASARLHAIAESVGRLLAG